MKEILSKIKHLYKRDSFNLARFSKVKLALVSSAFAAIGGYLILSSSAATPPPSPMPLISRSKPAFASSGTASNANDANYDTIWRSSAAISASTPAWLAYDLSSVPAAQRAQVYVGWYNDPITYPYDHVMDGSNAYNSIKDYTIQVNAAAGGGSAPTTGWTTLATVTGNVYHSRSHLVKIGSV
jgi:acyl-CoA thioesterase-1